MKKKLIALAAFMQESGITNFYSIQKKYSEHKEAAAFASKKYESLLKKSPSISDSISKFSDKQYLTFKTLFAINLSL